MLADGQSYPWDRLLIATGAAARPLPLLDKLGDRCFTLRHAADAECLRDTLLPGKSIVIVGAGTIGLELAASATQRGCQVTVVELAPTVMGRNAPAPVRDYLLARHQQAGVRVLLNSAIENGETLLADVMVYGIGIVANDALAREAGLETANGIIVDSACTTSDPDIFAAGDVAITRKSDGSLVRMESWENANFQAQIAAAAMLNLPLPEKTPGWFWTDQFNDNLQFVGEMQGESWFIRGNSDAHKAIWFNLQDGVIVGAVTLNQGREIRLLRKWIQAKKKPPMAALVDETILLKSI